MSTIRVNYTGAASSIQAAANRSRPGALQQPRVSLRGEAGTTLTLPLVPSSMEHSGLGRNYDTFERVGLKPLLSAGDLQLRVYTFSLVIVARDPDTGVIVTTRSSEPDLQKLLRMSETGERLHWTNLGPIEKGFFRLTSLSFTYVQRVFGSRQVTVAEAAVELTEASDAKVRVGPVSGGAKQPVTSSRGGTQSGSGAPARATSREHTVRRGETLSSIALAHLGRASRYPEIATLNRISNPNRISVGQVLKLPEA